MHPPTGARQRGREHGRDDGDDDDDSVDSAVRMNSLARCMVAEQNACHSKVRQPPVRCVVLVVLIDELLVLAGIVGTKSSILLASLPCFTKIGPFQSSKFWFPI